MLENKPGHLHSTVLSQTSLVTVALIVALVAVAYSILMQYESGDAAMWFVPWLKHIIAHGATPSLAEDMPVIVEEAHGLGNYTPPYLYLLIIGSFFHNIFEPLTIIKLVAIAGALFCAVSVYRLLAVFLSAEQALIAALGALLLPTVVLNSAAWGQSDTFYTGFLVLVVAAAMKDQWVTMMLAFGAAVAFKLQAVFIGPFLLYMVISRRVPLWGLLLPLVVFVGLMLPAWLAGRPAWQLATIYLDQANTWHYLSMNVPNPWAFIQYFHLVSYPVGVVIGLALATLAGLGLAAISLNWRLQGGDLLLLAVASTALMPYLLPKMHDRYFFAADILAYVLAVVRPRWWSVAVAASIQLGSLGAYGYNLLGFKMGPYLGAICISFGLLIIAWQLARTLWIVEVPLLRNTSTKKAS